MSLPLFCWWILISNRKRWTVGVRPPIEWLIAEFPKTRDDGRGVLASAEQGQRAGRGVEQPPVVRLAGARLDGVERGLPVPARHYRIARALRDHSGDDASHRVFAEVGFGC